MALFNPARCLILPCVLMFSFPLAFFGWITTTLAIVVLLCRVMVIYIELAIIVIPHYFLGSKAMQNQTSNLTSLKTQDSPPRRKRRRGSTSSNPSPTDTTNLFKSESLLGLAQSIGSTRDYEGLGGWRIDGHSVDAGSWPNIDPRFESLADRTSKHHRRSLTSGAISSDGKWDRGYDEEATMNTSRIRTPSAARTPSSSSIGGDGYHPLEMGMIRKTSRKSPVMTSASNFTGRAEAA